MRVVAFLFAVVAFSGALAEDCPELRTYELGTPIQEVISANPKVKFKALSKGNSLYRQEHLDRQSRATIYMRRMTWGDQTELHLVTDSPDGVVVEIFTTINSDPDDVYNSLVGKFGVPTTQSYGPNGDRGNLLGEHDIDAFWTLRCGAKVVFHGVGDSVRNAPVSRIRYTVEGFRKDILD